MKKELIILFNSVTPSGMSGGDRILIELARRWVKSYKKITFVTPEMGKSLCKKYGLNEDLFVYRVVPTDTYEKRSLFLLYLVRTYKACKYFLQHKIIDGSYIYSSSDFWPDSIPAFIAKLKNRNIKWIAGFYLFAPSPLDQNSPYNISLSKKVIGLVYWLSQRPIYYLVKKYADFVFVTSMPDAPKFITKIRNKDNIIVVRGGVDITESEKYLNSNKVTPVDQRKYDACYVGRFHYQKGVLELIDIWRKVVDVQKGAMLAMIGMGALNGDVKNLIKKYKLTKNIDLLGFKDGKEKYEIFQQSKIMVHPAVYDSGGMAAAEGLAWGLPGVSFDLEALKTYYPKGMIKSKIADNSDFAKNILLLIDDKEIYREYSKNAHDLILEQWNWDARAGQILSEIR